MTSLKVDAGACGCSALIRAERVDDRHVRVVIASECDQIVAMNQDLAQLQWKGKGHTVFGPMLQSTIYLSASKHIRHTACPVPAAILKAIEVEVGAALPADVSFRFESSSDAPADASPPGAGSSDEGQSKPV